MGLFVCLEPVDRHGGREGPDDGPGNGPGQLWPVWAAALVGGHQFLGRGRLPPLGEGCLDGVATIEEVGKVPGRHVSLFSPSYDTCHKWSYLVS